MCIYRPSSQDYPDVRPSHLSLGWREGRLSGSAGGGAVAGIDGSWPRELEGSGSRGRGCSRARELEFVLLIARTFEG
jgi:hypothetical protein